MESLRLDPVSVAGALRDGHECGAIDENGLPLMCMTGVVLRRGRALVCVRCRQKWKCCGFSRVVRSQCAVSAYYYARIKVWYSYYFYNRSFSALCANGSSTHRSPHV